MTEKAAYPTPLVSVAVPTYRGAAFVGQAIESVLCQTVTDFELLVVDNDSRDATARIVESFADARIRYFCNERNIGAQENWNRCLELARGRYFKLLPHDDLIRQDCLRRQVDVLEADVAQTIALAFSARTVISPEGRFLASRRFRKSGSGRVEATQLLRACVRRGTNVIGEPGCVMMRRSLATGIGRFDATYPYVIDLDFWLRLLQHGDAWYCAEPLASFRVSPNQWTAKLRGRQSTDFQRFIAHLDRSSRLPTSQWDRVCGRFTPALNSIARLAFYRFHFGS
jgi:glycosyltransferase involved in cell wall biosynthesis